MIKMSSLIFELFTSYFPYEKIEDNSLDGKVFLFGDDDEKDVYRVTIYENNLYNFVFTIINDFFIKIKKMYPIISSPDQLDKIKCKYIEFSRHVQQGVGNLSFDKTYGINPTKNFIKVLSTVNKIIKDNVNETDIIVFSSKGGSRTKLYNRMVDSYSHLYNIIKELDNNGSLLYILIPKTKKELL